MSYPGAAVSHTRRRDVAVRGTALVHRAQTIRNDQVGRPNCLDDVAESGPGRIRAAAVRAAGPWLMNALVALIRSQRGMAVRLLAVHVDDGSGRCRVCSAGGFSGRYVGRA